MKSRHDKPAVATTREFEWGSLPAKSFERWRREEAVAEKRIAKLEKHFSNVLKPVNPILGARSG